MTKRLYRSRTEKMIAGVAGGIAQYLDIDPVFVRIAFVVLIFFHGAGVIIYFVSAIIMPKEELVGSPQIVEEPEEKVKAKAVEKEKRRAHRGKIFGSILVALGVIFLADNLFMDITFENIFPITLICIGGWMVFNTFQKEKEIEAQQ